MALNVRRGKTVSKRNKIISRQKPVAKKPVLKQRPLEEVLAIKAVQNSAFVNACKAHGLNPRQYFKKRRRDLSLTPKVFNNEAGARGKAMRSFKKFDEASFLTKIMVNEFGSKKKRQAILKNLPKNCFIERNKGL